MVLRVHQIEQALDATGKRLTADGPKSVKLYLVGGSAGLIAGWLPESRTTGDVDVTDSEPFEALESVLRAAAAVAKEQEFPETWLNNDCRIFRHYLPLGWRDRSQHRRTFGALEVFVLHRKDFIAAKIVSAPGRPQDLEDLRELKPTADELDFASENLDRLERESLDADASFDDSRSILEYLRGDS